MTDSDPRFEIPERPLRGADTARDGIAEDDHPVPLWFNAAWVFTWIFGACYIVWYLGLSTWTARGAYDEEIAAARATAKAAAPAAAANPYAGDPAAIADGAQTFATICSACHGPDAHGLVGPSLVDPYWKYGGTDADRFKTVNEGRPGGMPAWGPQLGTERIWKVLAYIDTLPKTREPGFGAPDYVPPKPPPQ
ncbi:MAG TPA: c-type cytochrome [Myxococcota bacterium]|nr:c-type cytochrome [Myxococcota bacterium]